MIRPIAFAVALSGAGALPAAAQSFDVKLGNKTLGVLTLSEGGQKTELRSILSNTPLGVFNGSFEGVSQKLKGSARKFTGHSKSSRKNRQVSTVITDGRATQTEVSPEKERTELSDIAQVPQGVMDPVRAVGKLVAAKGGCPGVIRIYDGRRAIALTPTSKAQDGDLLTCEVAYRVTHGPGHLSPLKISSAKMALRYDLSGRRQELVQMQLGSGMFNLFLDRVN